MERPFDIMQHSQERGRGHIGGVQIKQATILQGPIASRQCFEGLSGHHRLAKRKTISVTAHRPNSFCKCQHSPTNSRRAHYYGDTAFC
jgi:hypothetical protein